MKKYFVIVLFFIVLHLNAQLKVIFPLFSDSITDYYYLNYGISLCNPKDGNYEEATAYLQSSQVSKNAKNLIYLRNLISYQTEGKLSTFEKINSSQISNKEKDFLKLWLFAVTKNDNDYELELNKNQKKYPNDIELTKIEIRKKLQDRQDLIYTSIDFKEISINIDKLLVNKKNSKEDEIYLKALQLDCEYFAYEDSKSMKTERRRILAEYSNLWKQNKTFFMDQYSKINFKLKSDNSAHYFDLTNEDIPDDSIFDDYLLIHYGNPVQTIAGSDNLKYIAFIQTNPFYYGGEWNGGYNLEKTEWNLSPKKVKSYNDFLIYLDKIETTINKYPGAIGPKYIFLDALIENKEIIYDGKIEVYQTKFLKRLIDIFALDQRADFENHFDYFRDFLKEDIPSTKFNDYYKLIFKQVKQNNSLEINDYLIEVKNKFPNNENIKTIINEFHNL